MNDLAILRIEKGKGNPNGLIAHIDRTASPEVAKLDYPHADESKFKDNKEYTSNYGKNAQKCIDDIMANGYKSKRKIRADVVKYANGILTASPEVMKTIVEQGKLEDWAQANIKWLHTKFGKDNFVRISMHVDETTPHIQFVFVPLTKDGRLSAKEVIGDRTALSQMQTEYAEAMKEFGINRGKFKSKATHKHYREYHQRINEIEEVELTTIEEVKTRFTQVVETREKHINQLYEKIEVIKDDFYTRNKVLKNDLATEKKNTSEIIDRKEKVAEIKENVHCLDFFNHLVSLGVLEFDKTVGYDYIFKKIGQETGSIQIKIKDNKWKDFDGGRQSDVFDACKIFLNKDFNESLDYLSDFKSTNSNFEPIQIVEPEINKTAPIDIKLDIQRPTNVALLEYADENGISRKTLDNSIVSELHYGYDYVDGTEIKQKNFFALALKNLSNGYSVRNKYDNRNIGNSDISLHKIEKSNVVMISEGLFDYLTLLELGYQNVNHIILNSTSNYKKLLNLQNIEDLRIYLFLNHNPKGIAVAEEIKKMYPNAKRATSFINNSVLKQDSEDWDYPSIAQYLKSEVRKEGMYKIMFDKITGKEEIFLGKDIEEKRGLKR